jgi:MOSC domain-containing protein YiiM
MTNQTNDASVHEKSGLDEQVTSAKGTVVSLHIAPSADVPMTALPSAQVVPGRGMVGDRYYLRRGRDTAYDELTCDVTLVEQETIEAMRQRKPAIDPGESARRNIVVRDCELSRLAERTFRIGTATLRGLAPRKSTDVSLENMQQLPHLESMEQAARCLVLPRSDLRAAVISQGTISVGDRIEVL